MPFFNMEADVLGKMSSLKRNQDICRICLEQKAKFNWDEEIFGFCGTRYKDCYYKYTKLDEADPGCFPTHLCEMCANELKNAHVFFEKALKSFNILKGLESKNFYMDKCNYLPAINDKVQALEWVCSPTENKTLIETECLSPLCKNEKIQKTASDKSKEISTEEFTTVLPTHFIHIQNLESSVQIPFEAQSPTNKKAYNKRKNESVISALEEEEVSSECLPIAKKRRKRKKCESSAKDSLSRNSHEINLSMDTKMVVEKIKKVKSVVALLEENQNESCDKTTIPSKNKSAKKSREKYLLMCSYCSLKVEGAKKLEKHEATHNENRERTYTCTQCGLKLYTDWSLNLHMKIHDTNRQRNHKCEFCEKSFFNKGALNVHRRIHLGLMIKCQICEKDFFRQVDLNKHLLKHSSSPLEKNVGKKKLLAECQYCNKSVLTVKLKEHIAIHLDKPQMKCKICDKNFFCRTKCTSHLRRFHLKNISEYEEFIHYYVDRNKRLSSLMIKQQLVVQPLIE